MTGQIIGRIGPKEPVMLRGTAVTSLGETSEVTVAVEIIRQRGEGAELEYLIETNLGDQIWVEAGDVERVER